MTAPVEREVTRATVEEALSRHFGRRYCVLTNRGTTALAAALHALDRAEGTRALFPAAMCSIPVFSARFAKWEPVFADVDLTNGNFDLADVERVLARGGIGAVIPVHMFGQPDDMEGLEALCRRHGAALVEDGALSMGAERNGRRVGTFGRISCLSFVRKMLPLEMGGALLTDEEALARRASSFVAGLPPERADRREEVSAAMRAFHSLTGYVAAGGWARASLLDPFAEEFRRLLLRGTAPEDWEGSIVLKELEDLPRKVQARRARAEIYDTALNSPFFSPMAGGLFAYPVRLKKLSAEDFLAYSDNFGYNFKRLAYPAIHRVFGSREDFPNAETLEREVIGFPLDEDRPLSDFWAYADEFCRSLGDYAAKQGDFPPPDGRGRLELRMGGGS